METHKRITITNKNLPIELRLPQNVFRSASPMNELCSYVEDWERTNFVWNRDYADTSPYLINRDISTDDKKIKREVKILLTVCSNEIKSILCRYKDSESDERKHRIDLTYNKYRDEIIKITGDVPTATNYAVIVSYSQLNGHQSVAWSMFGGEMMKNLKNNTDVRQSRKIVEADATTDDAFEYLGKYYKLVEGDVE